MLIFQNIRKFMVSYLGVGEGIFDADHPEGFLHSAALALVFAFGVGDLHFHVQDTPTDEEEHILKFLSNQAGF